MMIPSVWCFPTETCPYRVEFDLLFWSLFFFAGSNPFFAANFLLSQFAFFLSFSKAWLFLKERWIGIDDVNVRSVIGIHPLSPVNGYHFSHFPACHPVYRALVIPFFHLSCGSLG